VVLHCTYVALGNALGIHNDMWDIVWTHSHDKWSPSHRFKDVHAIDLNIWSNVDNYLVNERRKEWHKQNKLLESQIKARLPNKNLPFTWIVIHYNVDCLVFSNLLYSQVLIYVLLMTIAMRNASKSYELKKPQKYCPSIIALWWDHDYLSKHWCWICDFVGFT